MNFVNTVEGTYVAPSIKAIDNAYDNCSEIIEFIDKNLEWILYDLDDSKDRGIMYADVKIDYSTSPIVYSAIQQMYLQGKVFAKETGATFSQMDHVRFFKFPPDTGYTDIGHESTPLNPKEFCIVFHLNTVENGGEMIFEDFNIGFKPIEGSMIIFPANFAYRHNENAPKNIYKYVAVGWFA